MEVHPHMLRHATGYALANEGIDTRLIQDVPRSRRHPPHRALHGAVASQVGYGEGSVIAGVRGGDLAPTGGNGGSSILARPPRD